MEKRLPAPVPHSPTCANLSFLREKDSEGNKAGLADAQNTDRCGQEERATRAPLGVSSLEKTRTPLSLLLRAGARVPGPGLSGSRAAPAPPPWAAAPCAAEIPIKRRPLSARTEGTRALRGAGRKRGEGTASPWEGARRPHHPQAPPWPRAYRLWSVPRGIIAQL